MTSHDNSQEQGAMEELEETITAGLALFLRKEGKC
jgi:hypothetical protein